MLLPLLESGMGLRLREDIRFFLDSFYVLVILSNYVGFRFFPLGIW
jgi:hypothetical protein